MLKVLPSIFLLLIIKGKEESENLGKDLLNRKEPEREGFDDSLFYKPKKKSKIKIKPKKLLYNILFRPQKDQRTRLSFSLQSAV